jgi:hypothetical membrane protein
VIAGVTPPRQRPAPSRARLLAQLALAGVAVYVAIDVLLAFLRPRYSLLYNAESDYGRGPWYWVMDLNFLLRCALSLAIAAALYRTGRLGGRTRGGLALLVTWAICSGLLAFFADDPAPAPQHGSGVVHDVLGLIAFTAITIGVILISASLMSDPAWRRSAPVLLAISIAGALAYLLLGAPISTTTPRRPLRADLPRPGTPVDGHRRHRHRQADPSETARMTDSR